MAELEQYFSPKEIADKLHVSERTVWRWLRERKVTYTRIAGCVRIRESELRRMLLESQVRRRPRVSISGRQPLTPRFPPT